MNAAGDHSRLAGAMASLEGLSVQQSRCYRIDADRRRLIAVDAEWLSNQWPGTSDEIWIDIQASHPDEFCVFLEKLDLHPLIMEDCLDPYRSSQFSSYDTSLHFEFPVYSSDCFDDYLSVICVPRLLITIRTKQIPAVDSLLQDLDTQAQLNEGTKSALLYALLDLLGDHLIQAARNARDEIRRMSRMMDEDSDAVGIEEIVAAKRILQEVSTIAEDQLYCIRGLVPIDSDALAMSAQRDYLRDAVRTYETILRIVHRYEARAAELQQQYDSCLQARTESRIRILTILSAICMPLTLIAGIYGMNFARMPELGASWGYPATLAVMFFIAVGQLWFFYKRGWLG